MWKYAKSSRENKQKFSMKINTMDRDYIIYTYR